MSYILEALKHSEFQRELAEQPGASRAMRWRMRPRSLNAWTISTGVAALLALALALHVTFGGGVATGTRAKPPAAAAPLVEAVAAPAADARVAAAAAEEAPAQGLRAGVGSPPDAASAEPVPASVAERAGPGGAVAEIPANAGTVAALNDLAPELRRALPDLHLDVHAYLAQPARRFVMLNGRKYREGDRTVEGPVVAAITEAGLVLDYRNQRFSLSR
jgi:general secretion pathway protein B